MDIFFDLASGWSETAAEQTFLSVFICDCAKQDGDSPLLRHVCTSTAASTT